MSMHYDKFKTIGADSGKVERAYEGFRKFTSEGATTFSNAFGLYISIGFLVGLALSATTYVVVLGAIAKIVNPNKRGMVFGIATAAASFGMFIFIPITKNLLAHFELNVVFYVFW